MTMIMRARLLGTAAALVSVPLIGAMGQTTSPAPSESSPPAAIKPQTNTPPAQSPQAAPQAPASPEKSAASSASSALVGLPAVSSDGTKLGNVHSVKSGADGKPAIVLKTGGFLGFGGHLVAIPEGKFTRSGESIQVSMTADQVSKLPATPE